MASMTTTPVRVGVLGCGNVGGALVQLLATEADAITSSTGLSLRVEGVAVRSLDKPRPPELSADRLTQDAAALVNDPDIDVVVELIGGIEPAGSLIIEALKAGKPVVTANKELLASGGRAVGGGGRSRPRPVVRGIGGRCHPLDPPPAGVVGR